MILVTGAAGKLGRLVVHHLLARVPANTIVAGSRDPQALADLASKGVKTVELDFHKPATVEAALEGVDRVLLISGLDPQRFEGHRNVIDAAKKAGVKQLAYTSILHGEKNPLEMGADHHRTEKVLRDSGVPFTLLRNGWYFENATENLGSALEHGVFLGATAHGRYSPAARTDFAEAAAVVLTTPGHENKTYELAGDSALTIDDVVAEVNAQTGKKIAYQDLSRQDYAAKLESFGLPGYLAQILAECDWGIGAGALLDESRQLSRLIGRPTTSLAANVRQVLAK